MRTSRACRSTRSVNSGSIARCFWLSAGYRWRRGVPYHTIAFQFAGHAPDDLVVPLWSAHLDGAASEAIFPGFHGSEQGPAALGEVRAFCWNTLPVPELVCTGPFSRGCARASSRHALLRRDATASPIAAWGACLRRCLNVIGRIGRPAHPRKRLTAVVVDCATFREAMTIPPMEDSAAVWVKAADRMQPRQEALLGRLALTIFAATRLSNCADTQHKCRHL